MKTLNAGSIPPKRKVFTMVRVSTEAQNQDDRNGPATQRDDNEYIVKQHNLEAVKEWPFMVSGASIQKDDKFLRMLDELRHDKSIAGVVIPRIDRLVRLDRLSTFAFFESFEVAGKKIFCDLGELDPLKQDDQLKISLYAQFAGMDRARINRNTQGARQKSRQNPTTKPGAMPDWVGQKADGKFFYDDSERTIVTKAGTPKEKSRKTVPCGKILEAFERVYAGDVLAHVAEDLGYVERKTGKPLLGSLRNQLNSSWALGRKPSGVATNLADEPLVTQEMFDVVQTKLGTNRARYQTRKNRKSECLGAGLLFCECGARMIVQVDNRRPNIRAYVCQNYMRKLPCKSRTPRRKMQTADFAIVYAMVQYMVDRDFLKREVTKVLGKHRSSELAKKIKTLQKSIDDLEKRKTGLMDMAEDQGYTPALKQRMKVLNDKQTTDRNEMRQLQHQHDSEAMYGVDAETVAKELEAKFRGFAKMSLHDQKAALLANIQSITFDSLWLAKLEVKVGLPSARPSYFKNQLDEFGKRAEEMGTRHQAVLDDIKLAKRSCSPA